MNDVIKQILETDGVDRLKEWAAVGPIQRANMEQFAVMIAKHCSQICRYEHWESLEITIENDEFQEFNRGAKTGKKVASINCYKKIMESFDLI